MILSMTGYGRARQVLNGREITVELRGVNARFLEYSSRLPRAFAFLEDPLKKLVAARVSRGKVELSLTVQNTTAADTVVTVNWPLAKGYRDAMTALSEQLELKNDMSVSLIARMPDVLAQTAAPLDEEALWADVQAVAGQAVDAFLTMRAAEGEKLKADLLSHLDVVEQLVGRIEANTAGRVKAYSDKLYARLQELLADRSIDESRLVTEAAIFADKTAIDEGDRPPAQPYRPIPGHPFRRWPGGPQAGLLDPGAQPPRPTPSVPNARTWTSPAWWWS